ncbi:MAG: hydroxymethylglutaryl-CoA reductase [Acidobacteria bacterium]|nr:MAG: hydroxymethylglutaryl-CoA reductase [Acidobacteriota bacterium]
MAVSSIASSLPAQESRELALVPRFKEQGYGAEQVARRRAWLEERTASRLHHVGRFSIASEAMRGNVENPIGAAQMPLGVAGPLLVRGEHARGTFYVPLATTEGALVRSYERGMVVLTRAGGVETRLYADENRVAPIFFFDDVAAAHDFARTLPEHRERLRAEAESTTGHGKLLRLDAHPVGRQVIVSFRYHTADAQGMNMIVKATDRACRWLVRHSRARRYYVFSGWNGEKRAAGSLMAGGKGKKVVAGAKLPRALVKGFLRLTPEEVCDLWQHTVIGHLQAAALGYNGHYANGLTALFVATGQDVANVVNAATGITCFELDEGDLYASVTLPSLTVATVGGGTGLGTSRECLEMLGCAGTGGARKLAEIVAATLLAGEISMAAAIASGEFVAAHEAYGRNRPRGVAGEGGG